MRLRKPPTFPEFPDIDLYLRDLQQIVTRTIVMTPCWAQQNVSASQSNVSITLLGTSDNTVLVLPYGGMVVGISLVANAARSAGTLTAIPVVNGTASTTLSAVLDGKNTQYHSALRRSGPDNDEFQRNDPVGIQITTTAAWAPITADIVVNLYVVF